MTWPKPYDWVEAGLPFVLGRDSKLRLVTLTVADKPLRLLGRQGARQGAEGA